MVRKKSRILDVLTSFQKILKHKPSTEVMYEEVRMMKFKIRPLQGDISLLNLKNRNLIEMLWSLGKLDEIFHREFNKLSLPHREVLFRVFDNLYQQFQARLNTINLKQEKIADFSPTLEMEIFKELPLKKKYN